MIILWWKTRLTEETAWENTYEKTSFLALLLCCGAAFTASGAEKALDGNDFLVIEDGALQPVLEVSHLRDPSYSNADSEVLRFCVYVETDNDTDNDGMADLVKALVQVPRAAVEGEYKAGTIYDPTPYGAGTIEEAVAETELSFEENVIT